MDEPLSNLDAKLRVQMRAEIKKLQRELGVTTIYVTHDQVEAMTMGDRVAVMRKGVLQQVAPPQELYDQPANMFVAGFIGSPAMNMLEATVERARRPTAGRRRRDDASTLDDETVAARPGLRAYEGRAIVLGIRPEDLEDAALADRDAAAAPRPSELREALGSEVLIHFSVAARQAVTDEVRELAEDVGDDRAIDQLAAGAPTGHARRALQPRARGSAKATRSKSRSKRARCTSSTRTPASRSPEARPPADEARTYSSEAIIVGVSWPCELYRAVVGAISTLERSEDRANARWQRVHRNLRSSSHRGSSVGRDRGAAVRV